MNFLSLIGYGIALIGIILMITETMRYTHIGLFWSILGIFLGFIIAYLGGNLD